MDILSAILNPLRVRGTVICRGNVRAPWALRGGLPGPMFHVVVSGQGIVQQGTGEPKEFGAGDLILLVRGGEHVLADSLSTTPVQLADAVFRPPDRQVGDLLAGGDGVTTTLVCGTFEFEDAATHPLIASLPDVLVVHSSIAQWLDTTMTQLHEELRSDQPGCELIAGRLCEIMLVRALRAYLESGEADQLGLSKAFADPRIGRALALIHTQPHEGWRAACLADRVGMSRSAFFARFNELVGESPARYVMKVSMQHAARWIRESRERLTVAQLAKRLGYTSESAFSRAFTRFHGTSPGAFRRNRGERGDDALN